MTEEARRVFETSRFHTAVELAIVAELVRIGDLLEQRQDLGGASIVKDTVSRKAVRKAIKGRR